MKTGVKTLKLIIQPRRNVPSEMRCVRVHENVAAVRDVIDEKSRALQKNDDK